MHILRFQDMVTPELETMAHGKIVLTVNCREVQVAWFPALR